MVAGMRWCVLAALLLEIGAERWNWPDNGQSGRLDSKVQFIDSAKSPTTSETRLQKTQADEVPFREPTNTEGFYNRPPGDGRYPVRVEGKRNIDYHLHENYQQRPGDSGGLLAEDGTLDTLKYCKCVTTPNCETVVDSGACGPSQYLCCYNIPRRHGQANPEFFNNNHKLYAGETNVEGTFRPPTDLSLNGAFGRDEERNNVLLNPVSFKQPLNVHKQNVLVGPEGPTGITGPRKPILVGPEGPTGISGPAVNNHDKNLIFESEDLGPNESAQRGILVGPGGPTGIIGPNYNNRPVLVGPGGPTGMIGPYRQDLLLGPGISMGRTYRGGILVGPGGPTGMIGPGRSILVGPGGPTGRIGPSLSYGK